MSKAIFRYLRGELNGYYIQNLHNMLNTFTSDVKAFLCKFKKQQFAYGEMDGDSIYGLGTFAGIFLPRISRSDSLISVRMSESHINNGIECSEKGLLNIQEERFEFFPLAEDMNELATDINRSSLVGDEEVIGYIASDATDVIDDNGNVRTDKILASPPSGQAYSEFYGNKFLFLSEAEMTYAKLDLKLFVDLFKTLQWIRYNGASLASLVKVVSVVCPDGLVVIDSIAVGQNNKSLNVFYIYNDTAKTNLKRQRLSLFEYIIKLKFPQVVLVENI